MSIKNSIRAKPKTILFDWHATLVDTHDAMYHAVDDVLPLLNGLGLMERMVKTRDSKTLEDAKLVKYVRENARLHPKIKVDRRISRTDIFQVLFGNDEEAKKMVHHEFDQAYRNYFGQVHPLEEDIEQMLKALQALKIKIGVLTNRNREFMQHELAIVNGTGWEKYFQTVVCGDDVQRRKPAPDQILKALQDLGEQPNPHCWYLGDSTTDVVAAKEAKVTAIFYNGVDWDQKWIDKIFPSTVAHPHRPDAVISNFKEFMHLVRFEVFATAE